MPTIPVTNVGATPVRVTATATELDRGLLVIADPTNTATGFVGYGNAITPGTDTASGIPVFPGAWTFVPPEALFAPGTGRSDAANAYIVCASGSNKFYCVPDGDPRLAPAVLGSAPASLSNPLPVSLSVAGSAVSASNPVPVAPAIPADNYAVCQATNSTDASFPLLVPTTTRPAASATRCVLAWAGRASLLVTPFGVGADNSTLRVRVTGWQRNGSLWVPVLLCEVTGTLSTIVGVSGQVPPDTARLCDTLALNRGIGLILSSAADNASVAAFEVGIDGFDPVEVTFSRNGSATSVNALYQAF
jgi:hypothetical protein